MINSHKTIIVCLVLLLPVGAVLSQETIEEKPDPATEQNPTVEATPIEEPASKRTREKAAEKAVRDVQDVMTAQEFKSAGLDKLSSEELKNLNAWLQGYRQTAETKAVEKATAEVTKKAAAESRAKMDSLLSRIDGTFTGLTGHTIITLEDGTKWKQANADDRLRAQITDHPPVKVSHGTFGYKMRVVGTGEFYVDPVRK